MQIVEPNYTPAVPPIFHRNSSGNNPVNKTRLEELRSSRAFCAHSPVFDLAKELGCELPIIMEAACDRPETRVFCTEVRRIASEIVDQCHAPPVLRRDRRHYARHARSIAIYVCHVVAQISMTEIARAVGRHRTTIGYTCALIEDRRDDPAFDALVTMIERHVEQLVQTIGSPGHD